MRVPFRGPIRPLRRFVRIRTLALVLACAVEAGSLVTAYAFIRISARQAAAPVEATRFPGLQSHTTAQAGRGAGAANPTSLPTATDTPTATAAPAPPRPAPTPFPGRIGGMYWWEYLLDPVASPTTDPGFDPQGKPADVEIGRCYA